MTDLTLIKAEVGITNKYQDHVLRSQAMNIESQDFDLLMSSKLGSSRQIQPSVLADVANRTGGLQTRPDGFAPIEDGWDTSHGMCRLSFIVGAGGTDPTFEERLVILGYIVGGEVSKEFLIPPDARFVPVRQWYYTTTAVSNHMGWVNPVTKVARAGQYLVNDNITGQDMMAIRPKDIIDSTATSVFSSSQDEPFGGVDQDNDQGVRGFSSTLNLCGVTSSQSQNAHTGEYAKIMLASAARIGVVDGRSEDPYGQVAEGFSVKGANETEVTSDLFFSAMRAVRSSFKNFEGFTFDEIAYVFENFNDVLIANVADTTMYSVEDYRISSNEFGTSNPVELFATELSHMMQFILIKNNISTIEIVGSNNVTDGNLEVNQAPVEINTGPFMPIADGLDLDPIGTAEDVKEDIAAMFFGKHCSPYQYQNNIIEFRARFDLLVQSEITMRINGDPATERTFIPAIFAFNRFDPSQTNREVGLQVNKSFYDTLKNNLNY